jgi:hypothetical protein
MDLHSTIRPALAFLAAQKHLDGIALELPEAPQVGYGATEREAQ